MGSKETRRILKHARTGILVIVALSVQPPGVNELCVCVCVRTYYGVGIGWEVCIYFESMQLLERWSPLPSRDSEQYRDLVTKRPKKVRIYRQLMRHQTTSTTTAEPQMKDLFLPQSHPLYEGVHRYICRVLKSSYHNTIWLLSHRGHAVLPSG